ncbi:hypothetical protein HYH03_006008 [Edaphochlamys debaryana]|uniref:Cytochrome P450 n=1 Tax=Edaphochlamys debaryana TaxID=47281 RepID=A0A836C1Q0_9CHLO|nr:hypothetical protein HYH03_006008 [Edaphochlamys debaryana]|eukprot:KAG2495759.1 hypothetical protein HYH03_006008 [Edaphochlamys debaryana]
MDLTAFLRHCTTSYGTVCKFWFGTRPWVLISDPELVRKLANRWAARPPDFPEFMHVMTGENRAIDQVGIIAAEGEGWRKARRVFEASIIHPDSLAAHVPAIAASLDRFMPLLDRHAASGEPLEIGSRLQDLFLGMTGQIGYGVDFGLARHDGSGEGGPPASGAALVEAARDTLATMRMENATAYLPLQLMFPALAPAIRLLAHHLPDAKQARAMRARSRVAAVSRQLMEAWRAEREGEEGEAGGFTQVGGGIAGSSFMAAMMEGRRGGREENRLTELEVISQGFTFIAAGYETTAAVVSACLYLLAQNPEAQDRLAAELDSVLGDRPLTAELLGQLPYTEACFREALRIHTSVTFLVRHLREDLDVGGGRVVPKNSIVALATHALQHDESQWPEPERFLPERFLPEGGGKLGPTHPAAWAPFGMGPRMCVGHKLAMVMSKATLAALLRRHCVRLAPQQGPLRMRTGLTYGPDAVWLDVAPRKRA